MGSGKIRTGEISIQVSFDHTTCFIRYEDNGSGLNLQKLKALSGNNNLSDEHASQLIFQTGLSTNENVDEISGRGVGMDAIRNLVEKLDGHIEICLHKDEKKRDFCPFHFELKLPRRLFFIQDEPQKPVVEAV